MLPKKMYIAVQAQNKQEQQSKLTGGMQYISGICYGDLGRWISLGKRIRSWDR